MYRFNRHLLHKPLPNLSLKSSDGIKIFDDRKKAELFADTMTDQFQNNSGPHLQEIEDTFKEITQSRSPPSSSYVTPKEVWDIIRHLSPSKVPG